MQTCRIFATGSQISVQCFTKGFGKQGCNGCILFSSLFFKFIFPGNETKLGMSRGIPEPKLTAVDAMIDKLTGAIFVFQIVVVTVLGVAGNVWKDFEARKVCFRMLYMLHNSIVQSF